MVIANAGYRAPAIAHELIKDGGKADNQERLFLKI